MKYTEAIRAQMETQSRTPNDAITFSDLIAIHEREEQADTQAAAKAEGEKPE